METRCQIISRENHLIICLMNNKIFILIILVLCATSCKEVVSFTRTVQNRQYLGNEYKEMKGYTENQILRTMSSPTRIESDGVSGKILVYEDKQYITDSNSSYTTNSHSGGRATTTVGQNIWTGVPQANTTTSTSTTTQHNTTGQSITYEDKAFVNFFINSEGICYDVVTNVGDRYSEKITEKVCYKKPKAMSSGWLWTLCPPLTLFGIPISIAYIITNAAERNWKPSTENMVECK